MSELKAQAVETGEHGVRLQNLVIDAEYRFVELLPPPGHGGDRKSDAIKSAPADMILPRQRVAELRKVYGGVGADDLSELKAQAVETGEHGVRLQNLVIDAEYRFVELLPPPKRGGDMSMSPAGDMLGLPRDQVYKLRKVYGGLGVADFCPDCPGGHPRTPSPHVARNSLLRYAAPCQLDIITRKRAHHRERVSKGVQGPRIGRAR